MQQGKTCTLQLPVHYIYMYIDVVACAGPEVHVLHTNRFDREQAVAYLKAVGNALTTIFIRGSEQAVACLKAVGNALTTIFIRQRASSSKL